MTKIASAKQQRKARSAEDVEMLNPLHYAGGVLHVYDTPLKPHAEFPWLWSTNSLLEAVLKYQRGNGVSEAALAKFKKTKDPSQWVRSQARTATHWPKEVRVAGRTQKQELNMYKNTCMKPRLLEEYALQTVRGRFGGTYLCASLIVAYCRYLHPEFGALVDDFFARGIQGSNSVIAEVQVNAERAKGTPTRESSLEQWADWKAWNAEVGASHIQTTGEVTSGVLGASRKTYMERMGVKEPFRDNVAEPVLRAIVTGQALTMQIGSNLRVSDQHSANAVARLSGEHARQVSEVESLDDLRALTERVRRINARRK
jgi:hypothetical protein